MNVEAKNFIKSRVVLRVKNFEKKIIFLVVFENTEKYYIIIKIKRKIKDFCYLKNYQAINYFKKI